MHFGFASMNTPEEIPPDLLGRALEERGFESLWFGEHTHIPVSRHTPYPAGGEMPEVYKRIMDPYVGLMLAASATSRLRIGTGVALPLERDLLALAKTVSTLDRLSGGRLLFGVGVGWNEEELANHTSIPWRQRYGALAECIQALVQLWTEDEPSFDGRWFRFEPVWSYPKPLQEPHPPIVCGMAGRLGTKHAVAWADEWMPMDVALGDVDKKVGLFRRALEDAGRDPASVPITLSIFGDPDPAALAHYRDIGIHRVVIGPARTGWDDPSTTLPFLDRWATRIPDLG